MLLILLSDNAHIGSVRRMYLLRVLQCTTLIPRVTTSHVILAQYLVRLSNNLAYALLAEYTMNIDLPYMVSHYRTSHTASHAYSPAHLPELFLINFFLTRTHQSRTSMRVQLGDDGELHPTSEITKRTARHREKYGGGKVVRILFYRRVIWGAC